MAGEDVALPPEKNTGLQSFCRCRMQHLTARAAWLTWDDDGRRPQGAGGQRGLGEVPVSLQGGDGCDKVSVVPAVLHKDVRILSTTIYMEARRLWSQSSVKVKFFRNVLKFLQSDFNLWKQGHGI